MTLDKFSRYLQAYCDGELEASRMLEVETHLETCSSCRQVVEAEQAFRQELKSKLSQEPVPPHIAERLRAGIAEQEEVGERSRRLPVFGHATWAMALAASILLFTLGGLLGYLIAQRGPGLHPLVTEMVAKHMRFAVLENPAELPSTNTGKVAFWVQGQIGHPVRVPDYSSSGIQLLGGGVTHLNGNRAAYVVYEKGRNIISLFAFPQYGASFGGLKETRRQCMVFRTVEYRGQQILVWESDEMTYAMVSNVGWDEMIQCARVFFEAKKS